MLHLQEEFLALIWERCELLGMEQFREHVYIPIFILKRLGSIMQLFIKASGCGSAEWLLNWPASFHSSVSGTEQTPFSPNHQEGEVLNVELSHPSGRLLLLELVWFGVF